MHHLNVFYKCMKFHQNVLKGYQVVEQTQLTAQRTDRCEGENNMSPNPEGGRHKTMSPNKTYLSDVLKGFGSDFGSIVEGSCKVDDGFIRRLGLLSLLFGGMYMSTGGGKGGRYIIDSPAATFDPRV